MNGNFGSLEKRIDKLEDLIEQEWAEPVDAGNMFDLDCFTDEERQAWANFWQRVGSAFTTYHDGKGINLKDWSMDDLATLKNWALLYKERTGATA